MSTYLKINDLSLSFGDQKIFDKANLVISKPGFYCLMGRNGCGKTTLFKAILNEVKYQEGSIEIIGDSSQVSYCMADPVVFENLSVYENLKLITDDDKKINQLADIFNIGSILKESGRKCSAGEKQRICLIRAIIEDKPIILLDEATSHLDDFNSTKALDYIKQLSKNHVIIYSTHYEYDAKKYADAFIKIEDYKIILEEINELEDGEIKPIEKTDYYPKKLYRKITFWKPECLFSILFICMLCLTMTFTWLLNITPTKAYKEYQTKASNPQYSVIDDTQSSIYNNTGIITTYNNNNKFVDDFVNKNNKFKKGLKNVKLFISKNSSILIDYVMFDETIDDDTVLLTSRLRRQFKNNNCIIEDHLIFNDNYFSCKILEGSYTNTYYVSNQLTFKKLMKLNQENTTKNSDVTLISGRLPQASDEIAISDNFDSYDKENMTCTLTGYNVTRTYKITGIFNGKFNSITNKYILYVLTEEGYDYIFDADVLDIAPLKITYGNSYDLSLDDYDYIINNDMIINNEIIRYAIGAYNYVKQLKWPLIVAIIFIMTFDILFILFYLIYWKHSNIEKYDLLKVLKKTSKIKKDFIVSRVLTNLLILGVSIGAFFITQKIVNQNLIDGSIVYFSLKKGEVAVTINYFFNSFFIYVIPICVIVQSLICISQLRRGLK